MKIIEERLRGVIERYDYDSQSWAALVYLSSDGDRFEGTVCPVNVVSASTKRQCCADGAFEIGGAYAGTLSMVARLPGVTRNMLRAARIRLQSKYDTETAWEPVGTFWVVDARRQGEFFTISGQDGLGWADTSAYNQFSDDIAGKLAFLIGHNGAYWSLNSMASNTVGQYVEGVTSVVNLLAATQTGIAVTSSNADSLLPWRNWDETVNGDYCNQYTWRKLEDGSEWVKTDNPAYFTVYNDDEESGTSLTDCPRDYYRWIAQLAGGFITVGRDGYATLRQFWMKGLNPYPSNDSSVAYITTEDIEMDSAEVADYVLSVCKVLTVPEAVYYEDGVKKQSGYWQVYYDMSQFDYANRVPIRITVESNPILDGFCKRWKSPEAGSIAHGLWAAFHPSPTDITKEIRPFRATVHKAERYELGQKIRLHWRELGETTEKAYYSVITSVEWKFRGGHVLACAGEDTRVMADCVRMTKADKAVKELRNRMKTMRGTS